jgi:hypothetical protein
MSNKPLLQADDVDEVEEAEEVEAPTTKKVNSKKQLTSYFYIVDTNIPTPKAEKGSTKAKKKAPKAKKKAFSRPRKKERKTKKGPEVEVHITVLSSTITVTL